MSLGAIQKVLFLSFSYLTVADDIYLSSSLLLLLPINI